MSTNRFSDGKLRIMNQENQDVLHPDFRSLLTWLVSGVLCYLLISGALVYWLPFSVYSQYSVIVHSLTGVLSLLPAGWIVYLHWRRRDDAVTGHVAVLAKMAVALLVTSAISGLIIVLQSMLGTSVQSLWWLLHQLSAVAFGGVLLMHLLPILVRYRNTPSTPRRLARRWFFAAAIAILALPLSMTHWLTENEEAVVNFQGFPDDYDWRFGDDRPFWPSRAQVENIPWERELRGNLREILHDDERSNLLDALAEYGENAGGPLTRLERATSDMPLDPERKVMVDSFIASARKSLHQSGAIQADSLLGSATCGSGGCHQQIYDEWVPSAHGFSATDVLFRDVQEVLAETSGSADTRSCAGCHDPVALLSGARSGGSIRGDDLVMHEGNSCLVCHSVTETDTNGNGGYVLQLPQRYLFSGEQSSGEFWNKFLIRSYPQHHVNSYKRPLYEESEFCAACHKQTSTPGAETEIGLAQEQNEYDSWRQGHWYHEDDPEKTIGCQGCHMPLVDSHDPANDGSHRSHRTLGGNMYIPVVQNLPGGAEQASMTVQWLRGEIEIPEIADRWAEGPVVSMTIVAPDEIKSGELINLVLILHNNKTGHDFPAGPLDILASWVEVKVEDNFGRTLLHLGDPEGDKPTLDAPIVYKADWYDKRGLPVERHNIWEVVGASYKRSLQSSDADLIDIPFRCPVIARPKMSNSASESGPGERKSDIVFSVENQSVSELTVTARLLYRKADPEFLANIYALESNISAPVVELNRASHIISVSDD
jgi:hypothetical protein